MNIVSWNKRLKFAGSMCEYTVDAVQGCHENLSKKAVSEDS